MSMNNSWLTQAHLYSSTVVSGGYVDNITIFTFGGRESLPRIDPLSKFLQDMKLENPVE